MDNNKCIYLIHGFASAPKHPSEKAAVLEQVFGLSVKQLSYDSAASYQDNFAALKGQVDTEPLFFVGTSLGAFYASRLSELFYEQHAAMPIMLNPCHNPVASLGAHKGMNANFVTGKSFEFTERAIASYRDVPFINTSLIMPRWILLNMDDEQIDAHETQLLYKNTLEVIPFEYGGHRFENIGSKEVITVLERINSSYFIHCVANDWIQSGAKDIPQTASKQ